MDIDGYPERRRYRRVDASIGVRISTIEPERDPWTGRPFFRASEETCANVSRGGAFVRTREPFTPGKRILVELALPDGPPVEAIGRVAWSKRVLLPDSRDEVGGIGIEFLGGAPEHFSALEAYLDRTAPSTSEDEPEPVAASGSA
jgi:Tfp pilus assembly protein PilZ